MKSVGRRAKTTAQPTRVSPKAVFKMYNEKTDRKLQGDGMPWLTHLHRRNSPKWCRRSCQ